MPRYRLTIEYDGAPFVGWQYQDNGDSVQGVIQAAIAAAAGEQVIVHGSGRTDAGVHALAQVAHVDLARRWDEFRLVEALNHHLRPNPVAILAADLVGEDFHARFSARARRYLYRIVNRRAPLTIEAGRAWRVSAPLAEKAMAEAAGRLVGHHDFTTFRDTRCQAKSPEKTLDELAVRRHGEVIEVTCQARSFLHSQVRSMVGSLKLVGEGKWSPDDVAAALAARRRAACGPVAPACGLYLVDVTY